MIGYLEGKIRFKSPDHIIVDVQGVGYSVHVPLSTFYDLPELGRNTQLHVYTHVREDTLQLYGFRTLGDKEMFLHLITVNGVGPRLAMNILSGVNSDELRLLVAHQDYQRLRAIPGVGRKIAERVVLELRDKLKIKKDKDDGRPVSLSRELDVYSDAFSALLNLGYRPAEAEKALKRGREKAGEEPSLESLLKESLRVLA
jgi:Holliday junction DNA helicase RuvA